MLRIVADTERIALVKGNRCVGLKGPGILLLPPWPGRRALRINLGETGHLVSQDTAMFHKVLFPIELFGPSPRGAVTVTGFRPDRLQVQAAE